MSGLFDQITNYSPPLLTAGQVNYKGTWDASANTPTLVSPPAATSKGDYYVVSVAGTQFSITFAVGDWIISNGTAWEKVDLTDAVSSVFGRTGAVVGASTDYSSVGLTNTAIGASSPSTGAFTTVTASSTIAATGAVTGSNLSGTNTGDQTITLTGGVTGSGTGSFAATVVTNANLTGDVTSVGNATTLTNAPVIAKVLTGYVSGAGTVAATDSILQAIQKLNGNDATNANLTGAITSVGNATSLGSFSSANLSAALTDETGSGAAVFATSPTLVTPILGTPSSGTLSSCTGLPISTGVSGLGTGIATALAVNTGSAGAPVLFNGALGTPASGTVTNLTGTASININGTVGATTRNTVAATTISTTGTVTATANNIKAFVGTTGAGTGFAYGTYETNGGAQYGRVGIEGSVGGNLMIGTSAYDFIVGSISGNTWIGAGGTGIAKVSGTGLAVTGALSATSTFAAIGFGVNANPTGLGTSPTYARWLNTSGDFYVGCEGSTAGGFFTGSSAYASVFYSSNPIQAIISGTKRAEINSTGFAVTGQIAVGGSTIAASIRSTFTGNTIDGISLLDSADQSNTDFAVFRKANSTAIGSIRRVTTTDTVAYNTTSDGRLKENLRDFTDSGRLIDSLKPRVFDWKNSDENGKNVVGFIAQEEHAADPIFAHIGAVSVGDEDPETITKQWQRSDAALIPILVAELKALRQRVAALENS